jgi:hypothetical protein
VVKLGDQVNYVVGFRKNNWVTSVTVDLCSLETTADTNEAVNHNRIEF